MTYSARTFTLPDLKGISADQVAVHLKLYEGYVKHTNLIMERIAELRGETDEASVYTMNELRRRFSFEFDGMRMHEYYFEQFEGGSQTVADSSPLADIVSEKYGSLEKFIAHIKDVAGTRGIGWVVVYFDPRARVVHTTWVGDHELGQLSGLPILLVLDLWEHAFMVDYKPAEKKSYVEAFLENVNWTTIERRFLEEAV